MALGLGLRLGLTRGVLNDTESAVNIAPTVRTHSISHVSDDLLSLSYMDGSVTPNIPKFSLIENNSGNVQMGTSIELTNTGSGLGEYSFPTNITMSADYVICGGVFADASSGPTDGINLYLIDISTGTPVELDTINISGSNQRWDIKRITDTTAFLVYQDGSTTKCVVVSHDGVSLSLGAAISLAGLTALNSLDYPCASVLTTTLAHVGHNTRISRVTISGTTLTEANNLGMSDYNADHERFLERVSNTESLLVYRDTSDNWVMSKVTDNGTNITQGDVVTLEIDMETNLSANFYGNVDIINDYYAAVTLSQNTVGVIYYIIDTASLNFDRTIIPPESPDTSSDHSQPDKLTNNSFLVSWQSEPSKDLLTKVVTGLLNETQTSTITMPITIQVQGGVASDLSGVIDSAVVDYDATKAASYSGTGTALTSLIESPSVGSQADYNFTASAGLSFVGSAGDQAAYFSGWDGNQEFQHNTKNAGIFNQFHKSTTGGWWIAMAFRVPSITNASDFIFGNAGGNAEHGVAGLLNWDTLADQVRLFHYYGSGVEISGLTVGEDVIDREQDILIIFSADNSLSTSNLRVWANSRTANAEDDFLAQSTTDANDAFCIGSRAGNLGLSTNARFYSFSAGLEFLTDSRAELIINEYNSRHGRTYA